MTMDTSGRWGGKSDATRTISVRIFGILSLETPITSELSLDKTFPVIPTAEKKLKAE